MYYTVQYISSKEAEHETLVIEMVKIQKIQISRSCLKYFNPVRPRGPSHSKKDSGSRHPCQRSREKVGVLIWRIQVIVYCMLSGSRIGSCGGDGGGFGFCLVTNSSMDITMTRRKHPSAADG